ncbi:unnamed protein product, partial [Polarella glacialis]
ELLARTETEFRKRRRREASISGVEAAAVAAEAAVLRPWTITRASLDAQFAAALHAAEAAATAAPDPPGPDDTLLAFAQLAEDSAQFVASAAARRAWPQADSQRAAEFRAAEQAAQRASWAAGQAVACADSRDFDQEWSLKLRRAAVHSAEMAEKYARECRGLVNASPC